MSLPLTDPEKKVIGFLLGLSLLGAGVLFYKGRGAKAPGPPAVRPAGDRGKGMP